MPASGLQVYLAGTGLPLAIVHPTTREGSCQPDYQATYSTSRREQPDYVESLACISSALGMPPQIEKVLKVSTLHKRQGSTACAQYSMYPRCAKMDPKYSRVIN